jgi:hypothetical protein
MKGIGFEFPTREVRGPGLASNRDKNSRLEGAGSGDVGWPVFLLAFVVAALLLTFTAIPIQFKILAPFLLVPLVPDFRRGAETWLIAAAVFTGIQCLVGSVYVFWTGDGTFVTSCYPALREFVIGLTVVAALNGRSFKAVMLFMAIWVALQGCALGFEMAGGKSASLVPFPIFNARDAAFHQNFAALGRYGGFTFEAGILGGIASLFLELVVLSGYLIFRDRPRASLKLLSLMVIAIPLMGILALTLTKSGMFTITVASVVFLGVSALTGDLRSVVVAFVSLGIAILIVMAAIENNPTASKYVDNEVARVDSFLAAGDTSGIGDSGLATRVECAKLAFLGMADFPFGLGYDGLKTYLGEHLNDIILTPEMNENFAIDAFGLKGYFFNILAMSGALGVLSMLWMILMSAKPYLFASRRRSLAAPASVAAGLVALSLSAELMPFVGLCAFTYSAGMALKRESWAMASDGSRPLGSSGLGRPNRCVYGRGPGR